MSDPLPCPFCGSLLPMIRGYFTHPKNECYLSALKLDKSERSVSAWNKRAQVPLVKTNSRDLGMRFIDQIDADREAIRWLEDRAIALNAERIEWHNHETPGRTGSAWKGNVLLAVTVVLRDDLNWSVLVCHDVQADMALCEAGHNRIGRPFDRDLSAERGHD